MSLAPTSQRLKEEDTSSGSPSPTNRDVSREPSALIPEILLSIDGEQIEKKGSESHYMADSASIASSTNISPTPPPDSPNFKLKRRVTDLPPKVVPTPTLSKFEQMKLLFARSSVFDSAKSSTTSSLKDSKSSSKASSLSSHSDSSADDQKLPANAALAPDSSKIASRRTSFLGRIADSLVSKRPTTPTVPNMNVEELMGRLVEGVDCFNEPCFLTFDEMSYLIRESRALVMAQPILLELHGPVIICGDIHGQFSDLLGLIGLCGDPKDTRYLFLGDYVDRGSQSLETMLLLMCYKIKYPETFFLLRGNHECASINRVYGFYDECKRRAKVKIWKSFTDFFDVLPLAAIVSDKIFCVHGGLSPTLNSIADIREIPRPLNIESVGIEADLLWSDPKEDTQHWGMNEDRGVSFVFGPPQIDDFLKRFDFDLIVRAHTVVEDGYEFFHGRKLVTIFSAPNYTGAFDNKGAVMCVSKELRITFKFLNTSAQTRLKRPVSFNGLAALDLVDTPNVPRKGT